MQLSTPGSHGATRWATFSAAALETWPAFSAATSHCERHSSAGHAPLSCASVSSSVQPLHLGRAARGVEVL